MAEEKINIGEVFSQSFSVWEQNASTILLIGVIVYLPAQILIECVSILSEKFFPVTNLNSLKLLNQIYDIIRYLIGAIAFLAIVFQSYSSIKGDGQQATLSQLLLHGLHRWGKYIVTGLLAGAKFFLYFLMLIVPGVIKGVKLSLFDCVVATQETTPEAACERSEELVTGKWWLVFGFGILIIAIELMFEVFIGLVFFRSFHSTIASVILGVAVKLVETYFIVTKAVFFSKLENRITVGAA